MDITVNCVSLLWQSGALVAVVRGANCPLLVQTIIDQLAHEHKVLEGAAERREVELSFLSCVCRFILSHFFRCVLYN